MKLLVKEEFKLHYICKQFYCNMKTFYRLIILLFLLPTTSCEEDNATNDNNLIEFIPPRAAFVMKADNFLDVKNKLHKTKWYKQNKDKQIITQWQEGLKLLQNWPVQQSGYLSFTPIGKKELALSFATKSQADKSIPLADGEELKRFDYSGQEIKEVKLKQDTYFFTRFDDVVLFSSSQLMIENSIRNIESDLPANPGLLKCNKSTSSQFALFINFDRKEQLFHHWLPDYVINDVDDYNNWISLDAKLNEDGILLNGIINYDSEDHLSAFKSGKRHGVNITPANALTYLSMNYPDLENDNENQRRFKKYYDFIKLTDEFFKIRTTLSTMYGFHLDDPAKSIKYLKDISVKKDAFRDKQIYQLNKKDILSDFKAIEPQEVNYFTQIDDFVLLSDQLSALKNSIISYQNNSLLTSTPYVNLIDQNLTEKQNYFGLINFDELSKAETGLIQSDLFNNIKDLNFNGSKILSFQINHQDDINYLSTYIPQDQKSNRSSQPSQINRITIETPIAKNPEFFVNWRTQQRDLVFQDKNHKLYLYDTKGNLIWDKQLDSRIVGNIHTIDIYKNTRKQLCFTTQNKLYLLDKNGKDVAPFPKTFDNLITQGLSVFDYANTGRYRFVIVQNEKIRMFNRKLKQVKGFDYKPNGSVMASPKHIRIGKKDYILVKSQAEKAQILNRRGGKRVEIQREIDFSNNGIYEFNDQFITTSVKSDLVKIDQNGQVDSSNLDLEEDHLFAASPQNWAVIDENRLIINTIEKELDYGLYTQPQIHQLNERVLISFTDTQAGKIYLFNDQAELLPGFPIYGKTAIDLYENAQNELVFTCLGEENAVLVYKL